MRSLFNKLRPFGLQITLMLVLTISFSQTPFTFQFFTIPVIVTAAGLIAAGIVRTKGKTKRYTSVIAVLTAFAVTFLLNSLINFSIYQYVLYKNSGLNHFYYSGPFYMSLPFAIGTLVITSLVMLRLNSRDKANAAAT